MKKTHVLGAVLVLLATAAVVFLALSEPKVETRQITRPIPSERFYNAN